ncbi:hypothetical protein N7490_003098 [Penicillium lividum]|nr:hypothetical protein N7490_003098 [Penicillium lividum]
MSDVNEDVGHTVVHFLYTGAYETVSSPLGEGTSDLAREYKRSVLVYHASRTWGLTNLEVLAQQKMQHLDEELPVLEILRVVRGVFSSLPAGEAWLPGYIQGNLQRLLKPNDPGLGLRPVTKEPGPVPEEPEPVPEEYEPAPESVPQEPEPEESGSVPQEPELEESESVPQEPEPEESEPVPEEYEPAPESVPEESGSVPQGPEPVPEEYEPAPESVPEVSGSVPQEPEPAPVEALWAIPRVPAEVNDWARASLLPGNTPDAEILQESPRQGHIVRISCSDLPLYENWENLSSKRRAKRASKLRSIGLPVPNESGFISIVAA